MSNCLLIPVSCFATPVLFRRRQRGQRPFEYPSAHSIDVDRKNDRLLVAPSFSVRGDLTVLVNWQSRLTH